SQFVGEIGRELRESRKGVFESIQHFVESYRQRLELARPPARPHSFIQMSRPDLFERLRHFSERTQPSLGDSDRDYSRGEKTGREHNNEQNPKLFLDFFVARPVLRYLDRERLAGRFLNNRG